MTRFINLKVRRWQSVVANHFYPSTHPTSQVKSKWILMTTMTKKLNIAWIQSEYFLFHLFLIDSQLSGRMA